MLHVILSRINLSNQSINIKYQESLNQKKKKNASRHRDILKAAVGLNVHLVHSISAQYIDATHHTTHQPNLLHLNQFYGPTIAWSSTLLCYRWSPPSSPRSPSPPTRSSSPSPAFHSKKKSLLLVGWSVCHNLLKFDFHAPFCRITYLVIL